jgi:hypothetical protein
MDGGGGGGSAEPSSVSREGRKEWKGGGGFLLPFPFFLVVVCGDYVLGKGATRRSPRERRKPGKNGFGLGSGQNSKAVAVGSGSNVSCAGAGQGPEPFGAAFSFPRKNTSPPRGRVQEELSLGYHSLSLKRILFRSSLSITIHGKGTISCLIRRLDEKNIICKKIHLMNPNLIYTLFFS